VFFTPAVQRGGVGDRWVFGKRCSRRTQALWTWLRTVALEGRRMATGTAYFSNYAVAY